MFGVGADKSLIEDAARKLIEVFFLNRLKHARADLDDIGYVIKREFLALARFAKFVSECAHVASPCEVGNMIGQAVSARYGQERVRGNFRASANGLYSHQLAEMQDQWIRCLTFDL